MEAPDTVTEALAFLAAEGYIDELRLDENGSEGDRVDGTDSPRTAIVDYTFRFEGPSDPADEAIVVGVRWPDQGRKGVLVSAFGPDADPESATLLTALAGNPARDRVPRRRPHGGTAQEPGATGLGRARDRRPGWDAPGDPSTAEER